MRHINSIRSLFAALAPVETRRLGKAFVHFLMALGAIGALAFAPSHAAADVIHVPADHPTIQKAIDAARDGNEIIVAPGTYNEALNLLGKAITLRGAAGAEATILDGTGLETSIITCNSGEGPETVIRGLTITNGNSQNGGGGVRCLNSHPTIVECHFIGNRSTTSGGAIRIFGGTEGEPMEVRDCVFIRNFAVGNVYTGGGAIYSTYRHVAIRNCTFYENATMDILSSIRGQGGAIWLDGISNLSVIEGCTFIANFAMVGGAVFIANAHTLTRNSTFDSNYARDRGGGLYLQSEGQEVVGCTFSRNYGVIASAVHSFCCTRFDRCVFQDHGIGLPFFAGYELAQVSQSSFTNCEFIDNSRGVLLGNANNLTNCLFLGNHRRVLVTYGSNWTTTLTNCTIVGNDPEFESYAVITNTASMNLSNSILWDNAGTLINNSGQMLNVTDTIIQGGHPGPGNLDVDPLFLDPTTGNLRLDAISPAVDSGSNADVPKEATTDLDGNSRIVDGTGDGFSIVDRGPYEHQPGGCDPTNFEHIKALQIEPAGLTVTVGFTDILHAIAQTADGNLIDVSKHFCAQWSSDDENVATVDFRGRMRGVSPGKTTVRIALPGLDAHTDIRVEANGHVTYVKDTGNAESCFYLNIPASITWLKQFEIVEGAETITEILVDWGHAIFPGATIAVYLWSDPSQDGHPGDAMVLTSVDVAPLPTFRLFERIAISPTYVGPAGTSFFVGVIKTNAGPGICFVPFDWTLPEPPQGGSWIGANSLGQIDPNDLDSVGLTHTHQGDFLIRAEGVPGTHPADLNADGVVDINDLLILLKAWGPCPPPPPEHGGPIFGGCIGDINGDGSVDVQDLLMLLANWG